MGTITALEPQQHDPERVNVFLDGTFAVGVSRAAVLSHRLSIGQELSSEQMQLLRDEDAVDRAYGSALNYLSYRPRSGREISDNLRRKNIEPPIIEAVLERLAGVGLLDDPEFARFWVQNRQDFRPRGTRALRMELRAKGVDREIVEDALAVIVDEEALAYRAGTKKARSLSNLDEREFFRKMSAFLQRRGFPWDVVAAATRRLYGELATDQSEVESVD